MARRSGHLIGVNPSSTTASASGLWSLHDVTARVRDESWPTDPNAISFVAIPNMTGLTSPSGTVTMVSSNSSSNAVAWKLFKGSATTGSDDILVGRNSYNDPPRSIRYDFASGAQSLVGGYFIRHGVANYQDRANHWKFQGSNDGGATWTTIDERNNQDGAFYSAGTPHTAGALLTFTLAAPALYSSYRWLFDADDNGDFVWHSLGLTQ